MRGDRLVGSHGPGVWRTRDFADDGAILDRAETSGHPDVVAFLVTSDAGVYLTRIAAVELRAALDVLLAVPDEPAPVDDPSVQSLPTTAAAVAEEVDALAANLSGRLSEFACGDAYRAGVGVVTLAAHVKALADAIAGAS